MALDDNLITIGEFVDALIRAEQMEKEKPIGLTAFLKCISNEAGLSTRQIGRIRDSEDFPESNAINKLIPVIAQQMRAIRLGDIAHRLILPWESILDDQNRLIEKSKNNTITVLAGWNPPRGLEEDSIAESITEHLQNGTSYVFLYPDPSKYPKEETPQSEENVSMAEDAVRKIVNDWMDELKRKVQGIWYLKLMKNGDTSRKDTELLEEFKKEVQEKIRHKYTTENTNLWNLLPSNFCVLYNIDLEKEEEFCYGYFVIDGSIVLAKNSKGINRVKSYGHLYINRDNYLKIRASYKESIKSSDQKL
jgi:hypothetical protein